MGLGEIFDTIIETAGNSAQGLMYREANSNYNSFVSGAEARNRARFNEEQRQRYASQNSSNSSGGGIGTLILGAALLGGLALLGGNNDKNKTAK